MDYTLAALKLLCEQLKQVKQQTPSQSSFNYRGILFQRAWVQGILASVSDINDVPKGGEDRSHFLLDDGTGVVELQITNDFLAQNTWITLLTGKYIMVVGHYLPGDGQIPVIKVHKIVDLSAFPDREAMWYLEVIEAFKMFYQPIFDD